MKIPQKHICSVFFIFFLNFSIIFFLSTPVLAEIDRADSCTCDHYPESGDAYVVQGCSKSTNTAMCRGSSPGCDCRDDVKCGQPGATVCNGETNCEDGNPPRSDGICRDNTIITSPLPDFDFCMGLTDPTARGKCYSCTGDTKSGSANGVWTGLGCIRSDAKSFVVDFLNIALGVAGGIALLLMVYGAFLVSVSAGDPKKADEGKEVITGAIAGLLFIIFSVFLLKFIGVDILKIPGIS